MAARKTFVALPVVINGKPVSLLAPNHVQETTARDRWCLLLKGEGGLGKSTLAFQLGLWALAEDEIERLCKDRKMIPILIEPHIGFDVRSDVTTFKRALRGRLQQFLGTKDPVSEGLFEQLLRNRYILVILDGLSEMTMSPASPLAARPEHADFPANALVVTSRIDERLNEDLTIEPQRIDSTHLLGFINTYLMSAGQTGLADSELFESSRRLADLVTIETGITPLLARLFADQLVRLQEANESIQKLPRSVPDLMLAYLNSLNRNRSEGDPDDPILHEAARIAAWECMKATLRPGQPGSKSVIREALIEAGIAEPLLERLETIGILRTNEPAKTHVRFELDPLSEYLAALQLLRFVGQESTTWHAFFEEADKKPGAPGSIRGFLLAVWDCSEAQSPDGAIPEFVSTELTTRLALDLANVNRRRRRLSN